MACFRGNTKLFFAEQNFEYPTRPGIPLHKDVAPVPIERLSTIKQSDLSDLGPTRRTLRSRPTVDDGTLLLAPVWFFGGLALLPIVGLMLVLANPPADPFGILLPTFSGCSSSSCLHSIAQTTALLESLSH